MKVVSSNASNSVLRAERFFEENRSLEWNERELVGPS